MKKLPNGSIYSRVVRGYTMIAASVTATLGIWITDLSEFSHWIPWIRVKELILRPVDQEWPDDANFGD